MSKVVYTFSNIYTQQICLQYGKPTYKSTCIACRALFNKLLQWQCLIIKYPTLFNRRPPPNAWNVLSGDRVRGEEREWKGSCLFLLQRMLKQLFLINDFFLFFKMIKVNSLWFAWKMIIHSYRFNGYAKNSTCISNHIT